jgi:hypothetical protein
MRHRHANRHGTDTGPQWLRAVGVLVQPEDTERQLQRGRPRDAGRRGNVTPTRSESDRGEGGRGTMGGGDPLTEPKLR